MRCVNHPETEVQSFCQSCGKPLCASCVRTTPQGQILCENCLATGGANPGQAYWQAAQAFVTPPPGAPNPSAAALLGLIPGVGAMYNGQLFKGLIHVVIFAVLVSITDRYGIFGIFIGAWVLYQSFEAYHTAKARRDGLPVPDPFGLNELGSWLNLGGSGRSPHEQTPPPPPPAGGPVPGSGYGAVPGAGPATGYTAGPVQTDPPPYTAPYTSSWSNDPGYPPAQPPYSGQPANPGPYDPGPYNPGSYYPGGPNPGMPIPGVPNPGSPNPGPYGENYPPGYIPPIPPIPPDRMIRPFGYRGREPVWAFILIGLGIIFLLKSMHIFSHLFHYAWPVLLIGLGVWLIVRRVGTTQGGPK